MDNLKNKIEESLLLSDEAKEALLINYDEMPEEMRKILAGILDGEEREINKIQAEFETEMAAGLHDLENKMLPMVEDKEGLKNFLAIMQNRLKAESKGEDIGSLFDGAAEEVL